MRQRRSKCEWGVLTTVSYTASIVGSITLRMGVTRLGGSSGVLSVRHSTQLIIGLTFSVYSIPR